MSVNRPFHLQLKINTRARVEEGEVVKRCCDMLEVLIDQTDFGREMLEHCVEMHICRVERLIEP